MMYRWTPDMRRFMRDASEFGDYNERICERIVAQTEPDARVCEMGCGLGYLSLELAKHVAHVTSIDINADAIAVHRANCERLELSNVDVVEGDMNMLPADARFDCMVFCFCGKFDASLELARKHCTGSVFYITRNYTRHRFSLSHDEIFTDPAPAGIEYVTDVAPGFSREDVSLEFGQPFRSMEDAALFFETYRRPGAEVPGKEAIARMLVRTDREDFPFYLPHSKPISIISARMADVAVPTEGMRKPAWVWGNGGAMQRERSAREREREMQVASA